MSWHFFNPALDELDSFGVALGGGSLTVKEVDGAPSVSGVTILRVSNGTLTDDGGGQVTVTTGGGGGAAETAHPFLLMGA